MLPLHDFQLSFRQYMRGGASVAIARHVVSRAVPADDILAIHRNNFRLTLTDALASVFPAVRNLVGEECFSAVAGQFVEGFPPASPVLSAYGDGFPRFLDDHPSLSGVPYLGDVARLEWAWNTAFHAADAPALVPDELALAASGNADDVRLALHPAARLVASPYPVHRIWRMARFPDDHSDDIDLAAGADHLLVVRPRLEVAVRSVDLGTYALLRALRHGRTFAAAAESVLQTTPEFSFEASLGRLLAWGAFASLTQRAGGNDK